eukprot:scaffold8731_cov99-Skeletonema_marinoi.AAC.1
MHATVFEMASHLDPARLAAQLDHQGTYPSTPTVVATFAKSQDRSTLFHFSFIVACLPLPTRRCCDVVMHGVQHGCLPSAVAAVGRSP